MELTPLQTAIASNTLASGVLAFVFFYLWSQRRDDRAPVFWGAAYLCYCVRQALVLTATATVPLAADLLFVAVPLLILAGTLLFLGRRVPYGLLAAAAIILMLGSAAGYYGLIPRLLWLHIMVTAAGLMLFCVSGVLLHSRGRSARQHPILATLFGLWGAILISFPQIMHSMPLRVGYYLANAVALLLIALALIIASQRQQHRDALSARSAAETANQRFQDFVDTASAWIWEMDPERRVRFVSRQVFDSLGIPVEAFIGRRLAEVPGIASIDLGGREITDIYSPARPFSNVPIEVMTAAGRRVRIVISGKPIFDAEGRHTGYRGITIDVTQTARLQATLTAVTSAVAHSVGPDYFRLLVEHLTRDLGAEAAFVGRRLGDRVQTLAFYGDGKHQEPQDCSIEGTPCAETLADGLFIVERDVAGKFPADEALREKGVQGYASVALRSARGEVIGLIALLSKTPLRDVELLRSVLTAIAPRAGAEMERQIAETALRESEARFRSLIDNMPIGFYLMDGEGRYILRNQTLATWSGVEASRFLGKTVSEAAGPRSAEYAEIEDEVSEVLRTRGGVVRERDFLGLDGRRRPALISRFPMFGSTGQIAFIATFINDLTSLRHLEAQGREREALFSAVLDHMPIGFLLVDENGRAVRRNQTLQRWSARANEEVLGRAASETDHPPEDHAVIAAELREVIDHRTPLVRERQLTAADGGQRPILVHRFPIFGHANAVTHVATLVTDLTDIKSMEAQARQNEARLLRVVSALDLADRGVMVEDAGQRPLYVNRTASDIMDPEASALAMLDRAGVGSEFRAQGSWSGQIIHPTRHGTDVILQVSAARLPDGGTVTLLSDETERLERERRQAALERQVQEAQKMDAVGQLAGGIAHDFNNLIGAILGFARFIAEDSDSRSRVHGYAERILSATQRARDLIQQILAFSRRDAAPRQPASLAGLVEESAQLLRATLPATTTIEVHNNFAAAWSLVNPTQITQILVNLCINAADAMRGRNGALVLSLDRVLEDDARLPWLFTADSGSLPKVVASDRPGEPSRCYVGALAPGRPYLALGVRDEGSGIGLETLGKIFDPFFTTKPRGQGTGFGLAVVQKLVLAHDGAIVVSTHQGRGTLFEVFLPVSERADAAKIHGAETDTAASAPLPARGRVLVVDDDLHFGDMVSTALDRAGYEVGVCGRPREALEAMASQPGAWDILVTDHTMPEMSGLDLIGRLKSMHPGLRCILCAGYASSRVNAENAAAGGADAFFHKPVDVRELLRTIAVLSASRPPD